MAHNSESGGHAAECSRTHSPVAEAWIDEHRPIVAVMEWTFTSEVIEWRGPAPFYYLPMSPEDSEDFKIEASGLEYWGQVRVQVTIGETTFMTAVFPKEGRYLVPLRAAIRSGEGIDLGMPITATIRIDHSRRMS